MGLKSLVRITVISLLLISLVSAKGVASVGITCTAGWLNRDSTNVDGFGLLAIRLVLYNTTSSPLRLPTSGLGPTVVQTEGECFVEFSMVINNENGFSVIEPETRFSPVLLRQGEAAVIESTIKVPRKIPSVRISYFVDKIVGERYNLAAADLIGTLKISSVSIMSTQLGPNRRGQTEGSNRQDR